MTNPSSPPMVEAVALPSADLFSSGKVPEPLSEEERRWLVKQLHAYPRRVNEARTCAIGALSDMATTEFCRLMAERASLPQEGDAAKLKVLDHIRARILMVLGGERDGMSAPSIKAFQEIAEECAALAQSGDRHGR